ncbi:MAG: hypothetical protein ACOYD1_07880 [Candidatus Nanopelagicales bacterium]
MPKRYRGWSRAGRVPRWYERIGPRAAVDRLLLAKKQTGAGGMPWVIAASHIEGVWGHSHALTMRAGLDPEPLEFGAAVARHVLTCQQCQTDAATEIWGVALGTLKLDDVLRAFRLNGS